MKPAAIIAARPSVRSSAADRMHEKAVAFTKT